MDTQETGSQRVATWVVVAVGLFLLAVVNKWI